MFGGHNSLDIQAIDRPDSSYDMVIGNHVLEHVPNYRAAIAEVARITKPEGLVFLSFPNPISRQITEDWGYPKAEQHGHYRIFGRDVENVFALTIPHVHVVSAEDVDVVTGDRDMAYILTQSDDILRHLIQRGVATRIVQVRTAD